MRILEAMPQALLNASLTIALPVRVCICVRVGVCVCVGIALPGIATTCRRHIKWQLIIAISKSPESETGSRFSALAIICSSGRDSIRASLIVSLWHSLKFEARHWLPHQMSSNRRRSVPPKLPQAKISPTKKQMRKGKFTKNRKEKRKQQN